MKKSLEPSFAFTLALAVLATTPLGAMPEEPGVATAERSLEPRLAPPFRDNAVLQQKIELPVWGWSLPAAEVVVRFDGQSHKAIADADGRWRVVLDPMTAVPLKSVDALPIGKTMTVVCQKNGEQATKEIQNLVIGDVWLCAGQSNIAGKLKGKGTYQGEVADYPGFRHWTPTDEQGWLVCSPTTAGEFKKTAFYFGRDVYRESRVPIGLVVCAVGGSNIESWLNAEPYEKGKNYVRLVESSVGYGIRGMVWYQGESNARGSRSYRPLLTSLINGWREAWGQGDFSFYYVQLPGYGVPENQVNHTLAGWPALRQDQLETLSVANTGMAVTIDIGDKSVHPPNKVDTGKRLARLALYYDYGVETRLPCGPLYESHRIDGAAVRVEFKFAEGLMLAEKVGLNQPQAVKDKPLESLLLQDKQGTWYRATGQIEGTELIVKSRQVTEPVAVRYACSSHPTGPLLYNKDGLPASPFTTERTNVSK